MEEERLQLRGDDLTNKVASKFCQLSPSGETLVSSSFTAKFLLLGEELRLNYSPGTMGGICSEKNFRSIAVSTPSGSAPEPDGHSSQGSDTEYQFCWWTSQTANNKDFTTQSTEDSVEEGKLQEPFSFPYMNINANNQSHGDGVFDGIPRLSRVFSHQPRSTRFKPDSVEEGQLQEPFSFPYMNINGNNQSHGDGVFDGIPRLSRVFSHQPRPTRFKLDATAKVSEMSSLLGRAGTAWLGKAVDVLDTLGSSMTNLNLISGFVTGAITKGNKISILAFEVANTIVKGSNLMQSVSKENAKHLKELVLPSEGVQYLVSKDMDELLRIGAADKREELKIFSREVVRFGNSCKDPQWHNLDRYFGRLGSELTPRKQLKDEAETVMQQLMVSVQYTAELYHELHALDRFEQDYGRKVQEEDNSNASQRGDSLAILRVELKTQRKHVRSLKKKSLWSKILEEVMEKLVDIVYYLHREIDYAFGSAGTDGLVKESVSSHHRLRPAGLALHYANLITQIDTLVSRSSSVPPNTRDSLYQGLPPSVKSSLRSKLQSFQVKEELTVPQIRAEMEKNLQWLVPIATNTTKAHHGFGWVGEWASTGSEVNRTPTGQTELIRIETLYHADKEKTEAYILDLVVWLNHLICQSRSGMNIGFRSPIKSPIRSPTQMAILHPTSKLNSPSSILTNEDREMLRYVDKRKLTPGISESQEFTVKTRWTKHDSINHCSASGSMEFISSIRRPSTVPVIDFDLDKTKTLDVIDRVDTF